jgi:hypothetical protein
MADDERLYRETGITVCRLGPSTDEQARLLIVFLLFIAFVGSHLKALWRTWLTVAALSGVVLVYLYWWHHYFRLAAIPGVETQFIRHVFFLYRGNYLDVAISAAIALLIAIHVTTSLVPLLIGRDLES